MAVAGSAIREATGLIAQLAGLVVLAGSIAALAAFLYRWYVRERIPVGLSLLVGLAGVAAYLNTSRALGQVIGGSTLPTEAEVALFNVAAFGLATVGAVLGQRVGDSLGDDVAFGGGRDRTDSELGRLVKSVGRVVTVTLPEEVEDAVGYDPVPDETKTKLAGRSFLFPRRLTVGELRDRLITRLRTDYGVGHVDVELADDGGVEYLALGSRAAGIGPTLPPATTAVAIRADPAFAASAGDVVQVWETDPMRRVLTAELRGVADETVTVAIDAADTPKVDPRKQYRLVTLPVDDRPDREFASLLRAAEETFSSVTVEAGSPLHGLPVGALTPTIVAVRREDGEAVALPDRGYVLAPGETVFAIARSESLRRLERAARPLEPSLIPARRDAETADDTGTTGPDESPTRDQRTGPGASSPVETGSDEPPGPAPDPDAAGSTTAGTAPESGPGEPETGPAAGEEATESRTDSRETEEVRARTDDAGAGGSTAADAADRDRPAEQPTPDDPGTDGVDSASGQADASSFQELKAEFESGDADWDDESPGGDESSGLGLEDDDLFGDESESDDPAARDDDEEEFGLADDIGFGDGPGEQDAGSRADAQRNSGDGAHSRDGDQNEQDEEENGSDGDDEGGGAKSFQELKAEFESGDADWDDEESPGGDMRLDE
jgi:hypothetical protein